MSAKHEQLARTYAGRLLTESKQVVEADLRKLDTTDLRLTLVEADNKGYLNLVSVINGLLKDRK